MELLEPIWQGDCHQTWPSKRCSVVQLWNKCCYCGDEPLGEGWVERSDVRLYCILKMCIFSVILKVQFTNTKNESRNLPLDNIYCWHCLIHLTLMC